MKHRRPSRLERLLAAHDRSEADEAAIRGAELQPSSAQARPGRTCRDCGNRAGSDACIRACGGAR